MNSIQIPVGISDFERIRENNYYYIDKSGLLIDMLKEEMDQVMLITRPRRFGKTLGMSMFSSFLDIRKDSGKLFKGLKIAEHKDICQNWMNKYPTLFLSFKDVDGMNFENAFALLKFGISLFCDEHSYLESSDLVTDTQKKIFHRLREQTATITDVQSSLLILMNMMKRYYGKPVVLLIDEYDVPIAKASSNGYYKEMLEVMKAMLSAALKDNSALKFAVITGCLKIAKESIFTGTNNFVSDTIATTRFNEYFGFTQQEVDKILKDAGMEDKKAVIKEWYDGYQFGGCDVYCPWDVMNYFQDLKRNPDAKPISYWKNTSDNAIIRSFIDQLGSTISKKLEMLMAGESIDQQIEENLTYDYLHSSEENFWSILYLTGYLTQDSQQVDEMFQRMVFNVLTDNKDDHVKNFSFICREGKWSLAPAYDLTLCKEGYHGEHATSANNKGNPDIEDMLAVGESIRIPRRKGMEIINHMINHCQEILSTRFE